MRRNNKLLIVLYLFISLLTVNGWPGMKTHNNNNNNHHHHYNINNNNNKEAEYIADNDGSASIIGPPCTVNAHNTFSNIKCPTMPQPPPPAGSSPIPTLHTLPNAFTIQWNMFFVKDDNDKPPYFPIPRTEFNVTTGRTFYQVVNETIRNMRETYDKFCIPVFADMSSPLGQRNDFSCDFINVGITNTSYVVLHDDRPDGAPQCCIIGQPFHPPPPNFTKDMPVSYRHTIGVNSTYATVADTYCVYDADAGPFCYSFDAENGEPHSFYMKGIPSIANWLYQPFYQLDIQNPPQDTWNIPEACDKATYCPGWKPWKP